MPTDAKCGLLVGVGLILAVAVLFFQKDPPPADPPPPAPAVVQTRAPAAAVKAPDVLPAREPALAPARPVSRTAGDELP